MATRAGSGWLVLALAACDGAEYAPFAGEDPPPVEDDEFGDELPLPAYDGEPLPDTPVGAWTWVDFPDAFCRDGTPTGIGVRRGASDNLLIFFEGGGACFNGFTCLANPDRFGREEFADWSGGEYGIFDARHPDNPVADWTAVYVPYCTGDVHAGDRAGVTIADAPGEQRFAGYTNVDAFLRRIVPSFGAAPEVLVTGVSAGGFGAGFNYHRLARIFPGKVTLIDDSGPVMRDEYLAPCLQTQWRAQWGLDATIPVACDDCFQADGGGIHRMIAWLGERHPNQRMGLISSERDTIISSFYSFGLDECAGLGVYPGGKFTEGLYDFRDTVLRPAGNWGSFFIPGNNHTWLGGYRFYDTEVDGVLLVDWVTDLLAGEVAHVSPPPIG